MALTDIKDAGILATVSLWGWPYHGLCTAGVIDLGGSLTKTITAPEHGSAWLYDLGLPAIVRTSEQLLADADLGHSWRNYSMISGGVLYGTQLGADTFIHVDESGVPWMIVLSYSYPESTLQKVRITFSIVRFGLISAAPPLTPITVVRDVQCTYYTYTIYGYTYNGPTTSLLEDVWTNGSKCLVSVAQTRITDPTLKDIFSLVEIVISGVGGVDGTGLTINATEIMTDAQLSKSTITNTLPNIQQTFPGDPFSWVGSSPSWNPAWANGDIYWSDGPKTNGAGLEEGLAYNTHEFYPYARFAYYNSAGVAKVARLAKKREDKVTFVGAGRGTSGALTKNNTFCDGSPTASFVLHDSGWLTQSTTCLIEHMFGVYVMENDVVVDKLEIYQSASVTQEFLVYSGSYPETGLTVCDDRVFPPSSCGWGSAVGRRYEANCASITESAPSWGGTLAGAIGLGTPPHNDNWYVDGLGNPTEPLAVDSLALVWRNKANNYQASGGGVVRGAAQLAIQRIDAKSAAFYKPGTTRTYGTVLTPLGNKTVSLTPAGNLYFAWQRKTGDFVFSTSKVCYV